MTGDRITGHFITGWGDRRDAETGQVARQPTTFGGRFAIRNPRGHRFQRGPTKSVARGVKCQVFEVAGHAAPLKMHAGQGFEPVDPAAKPRWRCPAGPVGSREVAAHPPFRDGDEETREDVGQFSVLVGLSVKAVKERGEVRGVG